MRYSRYFRARQPGGRRTLTQQALAILARYGSAANMYLPGIGAINGITAGNWLDSAGTTAATVDNPVGLVASAEKQVGPELVTNGDGSTSVGWGGIAPSGGLFRFANQFDFLQQPLSLTDGKFYVISYDVAYVSGVAALSLSSSGFTGATTTLQQSIGKNTFVAICVNSALPLRFVQANAGTSIHIDNISVREIPGAQLTQATIANKPILKLFSGAYFWDFVSFDFFSSSLTAADRGFVCSSVNVSSLGATRAIYSAGRHTASVAGARYRVNATGEISLIGGNGSARDIFTCTAQVSAGQTSVVSAGWDESITALIGVGLTEQNFTKTVSYAGSSASQLGVLNVSSEPFAGLIGPTVIMTTVLPNATERTTLRKFIASLSGVAL